MLKYTNSIPKIVCAYKNVHIYHKHTQIREREVVCPHCIYQSVTVVINYGKVRFETNFTFIIFFRVIFFLIRWIWFIYLETTIKAFLWGEKKTTHSTGSVVVQKKKKKKIDERRHDPKFETGFP